LTKVIVKNKMSRFLWFTVYTVCAKHCSAIKPYLSLHVAIMYVLKKFRRTDLVTKVICLVGILGPYTVTHFVL